MSCAAVIAIAFIAIAQSKAEEKSMKETKEMPGCAMAANDANMCPMNMKMNCCIYDL